ncbi:MAG: hypothetical protein MI867_13055 [Pseudomonadales bacterium]|nr:hypothetical protein [Pseudomonadales bacterium]
MLTRHKPEIGVWYENIEQGDLFEVVAYDEESGFVATQFFDGAINELDAETFLKLPIRIAEQPEDWSGPYEIDGEPIDSDISTAPFEAWQSFEEHDDDNLIIQDMS